MSLIFAVQDEFTSTVKNLHLNNLALSLLPLILHVCNHGHRNLILKKGQNKDVRYEMRKTAGCQCLQAVVESNRKHERRVIWLLLCRIV